MSDVTNPADPNQGFPNPMHPDFAGTRTPEEQAAFDAEQARQQAIADAADAAPPANPTQAPGAAY
jgi:hypothetical protein